MIDLNKAINIELAAAKGETCSYYWLIPNFKVKRSHEHVY